MTTFVTPDPIRARVEIEMGDVHVFEAPAGQTVVDVVPRDTSDERDRRAAVETRVTCLDGVLEVAGPRRNAMLGPNRRSGAVRVSVALPTGSTLSATTGVGSIAADCDLGEVTARTSAGDVRLHDAAAADLRTGLGAVSARHVAGTVRCATGSGAIRIDRVDGTAVVRNANGDTRIGHSGDSLRVKSANGDIVVDRSRADVVVTTANGDVRVGSVEQGAVVLRTSLGRITLGIPNGTAARLDLRTSFGSVRNELDLADGPSEGERTATIDAQTSAGDIDVLRAVAGEE